MVTCRVEQTCDSSKGRTIAHLDEDAMAALGVERGDAVAIERDRQLSTSGYTRLAPTGP